MVQLDRQEELIVRELIKNPRISDNQISKNVNIPTMTVNRKRKKLEERGLLRYYTSLDTGVNGTGMFEAKQLYMVKLKIGITRDQYIESLEADKRFRQFNADFISQSLIGEKDGHLALIMVVDAKTESDLTDEFNGKIIPYMKEKLGEDCIVDVITCKITHQQRIHHNYLPFFNMEKGVIKKDWPDSWLFIDHTRDIKLNHDQRKIKNY